jgi:hypothetical protein
MKCKNTFNFLLPMILALLLFSCDNSEIADSADSESSTEESSENIRLNNGQKWKVNEEIIEHIALSEDVYESFEGDDYKSLSEELMEHTNNLIQSCKMTGLAHEELHKWLHPHLELIKEIKDATSENGEDYLVKLEDSFVDFHSFFE